MPKTLGDERHEALIRFIIGKRKQAGMTQTELAQKMGVYQSLIARLESGDRRVDVIEFINLGETLGFDPVQALAEIASV